MVERLRREREPYSIPHYDDTAAEVRAASKLAAIRRGMAVRKMYVLRPSFTLRLSRVWFHTLLKGATTTVQEDAPRVRAGT